MSEFVKVSRYAGVRVIRYTQIDSGSDPACSCESLHGFIRLIRALRL